MKNKIAAIEIKNKRFYIIPTLNFIDGLVSRHTSHDPARYNQMRFVVGEILKTRIDKAYPNGSGKITVELYLTESFFEISVTDKGVPGWQDFSYDQNKLGDKGNDLRNFIIDTCVDEIGMEKLGKDGQRIFVRQNILNPIAFKKPEPLTEEEVLDTNISIRRVTTQEDIIEAIRCIYSEYGYSYSYERLYYVDSFMSMIREGKILSFLAVNDHGQIAGHFALAFSDLYKNMPEISTVVIKKEFRGLRLFSKFMDFCEDYAVKQGLRALMGQPVAFHPMSQKAFLRAGYTATSLLMCYLGTDVESEYNKNEERLSLCASVKIIDKTAKSSIYPPAELEAFIKKVYDNIGWEYSFGNQFEIAKSTAVNIENNNPLKMTRIVVGEGAEDLEEILCRTKQDVIRRKYEMIELLISLNTPSCQHCYSTARKCGFNVSGIIPGGENADYIIMQLLTGDSIDYSGLVTVGEFEELKNEIESLNK